MSATPTSILVDTNVWLDNYLPNRKGHTAARRFFVAATATRGIALLYSAAILKDTFYILSSSLKEEAQKARGSVSREEALAISRIAWSCIDNMRELGTAVGIDEGDLWLACKLRGLNPDLEDNLILATAERAQAKYLVTSDEQLLRKSTVAALTPRDMAQLLETTV